MRLRHGLAWACCLAGSAARRPPLAPLRARLAYVDAVVEEGAARPRGWTAPLSAYLVALLSRAQHAMGLTGSVGEIGVYHGLFFLALAHAAARGERLFACDSFGREDAESFARSLESFGVDPSLVWLHRESSASLTLGRLKRAGLGRFRLLSIDGDHSAEAVEGDLRLAAAAVSAGGVVLLDDFPNDLWMGVREGFYRWLLAVNVTKPRLVPFLLVCNKLFLTTPSYHARMLSSVLADPLVASRALVEPEASGSGSTRIAGWPVAAQWRDDSLCAGALAEDLSLVWRRLALETAV